MRLLYVTESVPTRDKLHGDGSSMIPYEVLGHLPADVDVELVTFADDPVLTRELLAGRAATLLSTRGTRSSILRALFSRWHTSALQRDTRTAREVVRECSQRADVTLLHGPHLLPLAEQVSGPLVVQVVDPWSHQLRMTAELSSGWRRTYNGLKARQAPHAEKRLPARARLLTVGKRDATSWSQTLGRPVDAVPNGVNTDRLPPAGNLVPTICFVGSLNYAPNIESARRLVLEIAPRIWRERPDVHFTIAGRTPPDDVTRLASERVQVLANVPDVNDVFSRSHVALFPDEHGLGARNSVREALAAGLPVVATSSAAREQEAIEEILVAETDDDLAQLALGALARGPRPAREPLAGLRTWADVCDDYLRHCRAAIEADHAGVPGEQGTQLRPGPPVTVTVPVDRGEVRYGVNRQAGV